MLIAVPVCLIAGVTVFLCVFDKPSSFFFLFFFNSIVPLSKEKFDEDCLGDLVVWHFHYFCGLLCKSGGSDVHPGWDLPCKFSERIINANAIQNLNSRWHCFSWHASGYYFLFYTFMYIYIYIFFFFFFIISFLRDFMGNDEIQW